MKKTTKLTMKPLVSLSKRGKESSDPTTKPLASWEKRQRYSVCAVWTACLFLLASIARALPVALLGLLACAAALACVFAAEKLFAFVNGSRRNKKGKVPIYLFHYGKSPLGVSFQITIVLAATVCALFSYQWAVDACYKNVAAAYANVNVFRDMLQKNPLVEWTREINDAEKGAEKIDFNSGDDVVNEARTCFIEILREIKLAEPEEYLKLERSVLGVDLNYSTFQNQDGVRWLAEKLFPEGDVETAKNRFLPIDAQDGAKNSTLRMILEIAMKLNRDRDNKEQPTYFGDNVLILSDVFAGEPGAYDAYRNKFFEIIPRLQPNQNESEANDQTSVAFDKDDYAKIYAELFKELKQENGFGDKFSIRSGFWNSLKTWFFRGAVPEDEETLNLLFNQEGAIDKGINSDIRFIDEEYDATSNDGKLNRTDVLFIQQFCLEMLSKTRENQGVKMANTWLSVFLGPEQFFMLIVFFICLLTMLSRLALYLSNRLRNGYLTLGPTSDGLATRAEIISGNVPNEDDRRSIIQLMRDQLHTFVDYIYPVALEIYNRYPEDQTRERNNDLADYLDYVMGYYNTMEQRSRWVINWAAVTLPAVGFIGTVRGMLLALGNADSIVRATTSAAQAAAITNVASSLSLAFTTTLIALSLGLVITLLNYWQIKQEKNYVAELDRALRLHFNIWNTSDSSSTGTGQIKQDQSARSETPK